MVKINWVSLKIWPNTNTSSNSIDRIWSEDLEMPEIILSDKTIEYRRQKGPNYRISAKFLNEIMDRSNFRQTREISQHEWDMPITQTQGKILRQLNKSYPVLLRLP